MKNKMTLLEYKEFTGYTYRQMAVLFNVGCATVHHWISGRSVPRKRTIEKIKKITHGLIDMTEQSLRMKSLKEKGLVGCLNDTGIASSNYKEKFNG